MVEPCKKCESLTLEVNSLNDKVSNLQKESLSFSKFKKSTNDLEKITSHQKRSQDKGGLGFSKHDQTTSTSLAKPITFVKAKEMETPKNSGSDALSDASTRRERARPLRNFENLSNVAYKPNTPQTPFANTRGNQVPIKRIENPKQSFNSGFRNGLGYTQPRVYNKPILPTPNTKPSTSYNKRSSFHNNQRHNSYYNQHSPQYQRNNYQRRNNSYSNQTFFRPQGYNYYKPSYQNQTTMIFP